MKKRIKSVLRSVPPDAVLDVQPPMRPDDGFIEMVSTPTLSLLPFPLASLCSFLPNLGLGRLQGNLCLVPDFNPPLPEDTTQRARNRAHTEGVKRKKKEGKKKRAEKARRKEEREKRQKLQRQAREEEESSIGEDDDDDDDEGDHPYDWLDSMAEEEEQPRGSSLSIEGQTPQALLLCCEPKDPGLGGAMTKGGGEPPRPQGSARPKVTGES
jgi:hypothetical protein